MGDFSNYSGKSKYYDDWSKLVVGKMKNETGNAAIEKFLGMKPNLYSIFVDNSNEHEKAKGLNRNVIATISERCFNTRMFCWTKKVWHIQWIESKLNIVEQEPMKSIEILCNAL